MSSNYKITNRELKSMREGQNSAWQGEIVSSVLQQAGKKKTSEQSVTAWGEKECMKF